MQDVQHFEGAILHFALRLALDLSNVVDDKLKDKTLAKVGAYDIHVELIIEQFALLI